MAAGNAIAQGSVILTANADQMASGLQKAEKKVQHWSKGLHKNLGADFAQEIGRRSFVGGVIGGFAGGGIGGGVSEIIANTMGLIVSETSDWVSGLTAAKEQSAATEKHLASVEKSIERSSKLSAEWRGAMVSSADVVASLESDMENLRSTIQAMGGDWKNAKARIDEVNEPSFAQFGRVLLFRQEDVFKEAIKNANTQSDAITKLTGKYRDLDQQLERTLDPRKDPAKMGALTRELAKMNDELVKINMNEIDQKLFDLEKLGANPAEIQNAMNMLVRLRDEKAKLAAQDEAMKEAAKLPPPWLNMALGFAGQLGAMGDQMKRPDNVLAGAVEAGTKEGYSLSVRNRFGDVGGQDANRENGRKLDAVRIAIQDGFRGIVDAMRGVGIL